MKTKTKIMIPVAAILISMVAAGCSDTNIAEISEDIISSEIQNETEISNNLAETTSLVSTGSSEYFSNRDLSGDYDESECVDISLENDTAKSSSSAVTIDGENVTITEEGTYILSGTLDNGIIIVDAEDIDKVQLVLDGVTINNDTGAAIYVRQADKVFITLAEGSVNSLSNGGSFVAIDDNNIDATIFSKDDLTLNGLGTLKIESPAGHGIVSKDSLTITGGTYEINAASSGLNGKDDICITNADFDITSGNDGIHAENSDDVTKGFVYIESGTFKINSSGDGISGAAYVLIEDGDFDIESGGGIENVKSHANNFGDFGGNGGFGGGRPEGMDGFGGGRPEGMDGFGGGRPEDMGGFGGNRPEDMNGFNGNSPEDIDGFDGNRPEDMNGFAVDENNDFGVRPENDGYSQTSDWAADDLYDDVDSSDANDGSESGKGIKSDGDISLSGGTFNIDSADDAIHSNAKITVDGGTFVISTGDDAFHADEDLVVNDGTIDIYESYEGLEGMTVVINDGNITLYATDDGINAAGGTDQSGFSGHTGDMFGSSSSNSYIQINGGVIHITAYGDGLDANGSLEITGGYIEVTGPTSGDTSVLDYDNSGVISGGTFIGSGSSMMAQSLTGNGQGVIAANIGNAEAGTAVSVTDESGNEIISYEPELPYNIVIISDSSIEQGETYTLSVGSASQDVTAS